MVSRLRLYEQIRKLYAKKYAFTGIEFCGVKELNALIRNDFMTVMS